MKNNQSNIIASFNEIEMVNGIIVKDISLEKQINGNITGHINNKPIKIVKKRTLRKRKHKKHSLSMKRKLTTKK